MISQKDKKFDTPDLLDSSLSENEVQQEKSRAKMSTSLADESVEFKHKDNTAFVRENKQKKENAKISVSPVFSSKTVKPFIESNQQSSISVSNLKEKPPLWFVLIFVAILIIFISINFLIVNKIFFQNSLLPGQIYYQEAKLPIEQDRSIEMKKGVLDNQELTGNEQLLKDLSPEEMKNELIMLSKTTKSIDVNGIYERLNLLDQEVDYP